jgi:uncharacterized protein YjeT (DUF2065 family)
MLADLRMPGALEALDTILQGVDGGTLTAPDAIERLLAALIQLRNNRLRHPGGCDHVARRGAGGGRMQARLKARQGSTN